MKNQRGFLQNFIIPSLVLVGIVLTGLIAMHGSGRAALNITESVDSARAQLVRIRQTINWCRAAYPAGDNGLAGHKAYPGSPVNGDWVKVRDLTCPGYVDAGQPVNIWRAAGELLDSPGLYLGDWEYRIAPDGAVALRLASATTGDSYGQAVLKQVAARLHASEKNLSADTLEIYLAR